MGRPCFLTHRLKATIANQVLDLCALGAQKLAVLQPRLVDLELLVEPQEPSAKDSGSLQPFIA